ncbi:MAG TPA: glycosyltransferase [Klebsiella sp.]|jgi:glycosyltransferase involved in cell wall biosynthesis
MSEKPCLFSVIIPVFNNELYIKQTLDSVLSQLDENTEVIIINDGSTDNSASIIQQTVDAYRGASRLHFFSQPNAGVSATRNVGLEMAQGAWFGFIDGDDLWCPDFWQTIKPIILQHEVDLIDFQYHYFKDQLPESVTLPGSESSVIIEHKDHDALDEVFQRSYWHIWSRVYCRDLISKHRFFVGRRYEDMMFTPWLYLEANRILRLNKTLYWYRDNAYGITRNIQASDINDMVFALNQILTYVQTGSQTAIPMRLITSLIINCFNEIKGMHAKFYGFYNYSEQTMSALRTAGKLLPPASIPLKKRLHMRYPLFWKIASRFRHWVQQNQ